MKETELAAVVVDFLLTEGCEVYQEVKVGNRVADIVSVSDRGISVIEVKGAMGFDVMYQAELWIPYAQQVAVAVPWKQNRVTDFRLFQIQVCSDHCIGVLHVRVDVEPEPVVEPMSSPQLNERPTDLEVLKDALHERQKTYAPAGNAKRSAWSEFQQTRLNLVAYVKAHPGCALKEAVPQIEHHYSRRQPLKKRNTAARAKLTQLARDGNLRGIVTKTEGGLIHMYPAD